MMCYIVQFSVYVIVALNHSLKSIDLQATAVFYCSQQYLNPQEYSENVQYINNVTIIYLESICNMYLGSFQLGKKERMGDKS